MTGTVRILLAGLAGAIAMFVWASIAHMSPLGQVGFKTMPAAEETAVFDAVKAATGEQAGMYMGPAAQMTQMSGHGPHLLMVYKPDASYEMQPIQLIGEFVLELIQSIILAFVLAAIMASAGTRILYALGAGFMVGLATNGSYHIWFGFPHDYTLVQIGIQAIEYLVAGTAIAFVLPKRA